jgi:WD40 repeat protein
MKQARLVSAIICWATLAISITTQPIYAQTPSPRQECPGDRGFLRAVFSSDSKYVLANWNQGTARLWEISTGRSINTFRQGMDDITSVSLSRDNKYVLTASDREAVLWNIATGAKLRSFKHNNDDFGMGMSAQFLLNDKYVMTSIATEISLWETQTGQRIYTLPSNLEPLRDLDVQISSNGKCILNRRAVRSADDNGIQLRDALTGNLIHIFDGLSAKFSPDGKQILVVNTTGESLWDVESTKKLIDLTTTDNVGWELFSPNSKYLFLLLPDENDIFPGEVWDTINLKKVLTIDFKHPFIQVAFSSDSNYFIAIQYDRGQYILSRWDTRTLTKVSSYPTPIYDQTFVFLVSPNGNYLATYGPVPDAENVYLELWNSEGTKRIHTLC